MAKAEALQGSMDLLVLKILSRRPGLHGYAIMAAMDERFAADNDLSHFSDDLLSAALGGRPRPRRADRSEQCGSSPPRKTGDGWRAGSPSQPA